MKNQALVAAALKGSEANVQWAQITNNGQIKGFVVLTQTA